MALSEFALIKRYFQSSATAPGVVLGIGDDAAILTVTAGHELVVAVDTSVAGIHFPGDSDPFDIAWRALATNISDLASMGAIPRWYTLALTLPDINEAWLAAFSAGLFELASEVGMTLVGGDTTRGPLSITITVHGELAAGTALRRDGAKPGDRVWVSGVPGLAALGLQQWGRSVFDHEARTRFCRPQPRWVLGQRLQGHASACIDVSDGLLADAAHIAGRSGVAIELDADALPRHTAFDGLDEIVFQQLALAGGDDYELCFTAPPDAHDAILRLARELGVPCACIGLVTAGEGAQCAGTLAHIQGYDHFRDTP